MGAGGGRRVLVVSGAGNGGQGCRLCGEELENVTAMFFLEGLIQAKSPLKPFC